MEQANASGSCIVSGNINGLVFEGYDRCLWREKVNGCGSCVVSGTINGLFF